MTTEHAIFTAALDPQSSISKSIAIRLVDDAKQANLSAANFERGNIAEVEERQISLFLVVMHNNALGEVPTAKIQDQLRDLIKNIKTKADIDRIAAINIVTCSKGAFLPIADLSYVEGILNVISEYISEEVAVDLLALRYDMNETSIFDIKLGKIDILNMRDQSYHAAMMENFATVLSDNGVSLDPEALASAGPEVKDEIDAAMAEITGWTEGQSNQPSL